MTSLPKDTAAWVIDALDHATAELDRAREYDSGDPSQDVAYVAAMAAAGVQVLCFAVRAIVLALAEP
jgi:hypothetical protein